MKIEIQKLFSSDGSHRTIEELYKTLPKTIVDEVGWEDGTLVEIERTKTEDKDGVVHQGMLLRNIEDESVDNN